MPILSVRSALPGHRYPQQQLTDAFARVVAVHGGFDEAVLRRLHRNAGVESRHVVLPLEQYAELRRLRDRQRPLHRARRRARLPRPGRRPEGRGPDPVRRRPGRRRHRHRAGRAEPRGPDRRPGGAAARRQADAAGRARLRRRRGRHRPGARLPARPSRRRRRPGRGRAVLADRAARRRLDAEPGRQRPVRRRRRRRGRWPAPTGGRARSTCWPPAAGSTPTPSAPWAGTSPRAGCASCSTPRCPTMVERYLRDDVDEFLADHGLTRADIGFWVCHPGGPKVIEALESTLELPARGAPADVGVAGRASATCRRRRCCTCSRTPCATGGRSRGRTACCSRWARASAPSWCCCERQGWPDVESLVAFTVLVALVGLERLAELVVSVRNAAWSRARGGVETGLGHYPFMVVLHTGLLVGALVEAWVRRPRGPRLARRGRCPAGAGVAGPALVVHRHPRPPLEHPRDRGARAGPGHGRALPLAAAPQLRRGRRRGRRAAAGARELDHGGGLHGAERRPAGRADQGRGRGPGLAAELWAASRTVDA